MEVADGVNEYVEDQVLRGGDVNLTRAGGTVKALDELAGTFEEGEGVRQKQSAVLGQRLTAADAATLVVQFDLETLLQGEQTVAQPLLGDVQYPGGQAQSALPGQLHEGLYLIRGQRQDPVCHEATIQEKR